MVLCPHTFAFGGGACPAGALACRPIGGDFKRHHYAGAAGQRQGFGNGGFCWTPLRR